MKKRGQEAMEYTIIFGMVAVIIAILVVVYSQHSESTHDSILIQNVETTAKMIISGAEKEYYMGKGSSNIIKFNLPTRTKYIQSNSNELYLKIHLSKGETDLALPSDIKIEATSGVQSELGIEGMKEFVIVSLGSKVCLKLPNEKLKENTCEAQ